MNTIYKDNVRLSQKAAFLAYTTIVNGTSVGWAAGAIAVNSTFDLDMKTMAKPDFSLAGAYLMPGSVILTWVTSAGKWYALGTRPYRRTVNKSIIYFTNGCRKLLLRPSNFAGITPVMKKLCSVGECDDFYWEKPEFSKL